MVRLDVMAGNHMRRQPICADMQARKIHCQPTSRKLEHKVASHSSKLDYCTDEICEIEHPVRVEGKQAEKLGLNDDRTLGDEKIGWQGKAGKERRDVLA